MRTFPPGLWTSLGRDTPKCLFLRERCSERRCMKPPAAIMLLFHSLPSLALHIQWSWPRLSVEAHHLWTGLRLGLRRRGCGSATEFIYGRSSGVDFRDQSWFEAQPLLFRFRAGCSASLSRSSLIHIRSPLTIRMLPAPLYASKHASATCVLLLCPRCSCLCGWMWPGTAWFEA
jgi:hypothetical protein